MALKFLLEVPRLLALLVAVSPDQPLQRLQAIQRWVLVTV